MFKINSIKRIWEKAAHNAFTDLIEFNGTFFVCFREAKNHVSGDGIIRIVQLDKELGVTKTSSLRLSCCDLRDPKFSTTPDGQLMLLAYGRFDSLSYEGQVAKPMIWLSQDGLTFSAPKSVAHDYWWLWRIRWYRNDYVCGDNKRDTKAYGFAYNRGQETLKLYAGDPRRQFEIVNEEALSKSKHNLGYPNESDIIFKEQTAYAIVRRDADTCSSQLGIAKFPFKSWKWFDLGAYIGGPVISWLDDQTIIICGRIWTKKQFKTALLTLNLFSKKLQLQAILPSSGDCSYPGIVKRESSILISYYSSHQLKKSCIYLADVDITSQD